MRKVRITVTGRQAAAVVAIGVAASLLTWWRGPSPTGHAVADLVVLLVAVSFTVWCAAAAPWWSLAVGAALVTALAPWEWGLLGLVAVAGSIVLGTVHRAVPIERAALGALVVVVAGHLGDLLGLDAFTATTIAALVIVVPIAVLGFRRHQRRSRHVLWWAVSLTTTFVAVALVGTVVAAALAEDELRVGNREARGGLEYFRDGDLDNAADAFARAADALDAVDTHFGALWAQPARLVPVVAQHRDMAARVAGTGARTSASLAALLRTIDYDALSPSAGRIDLDAVRGLEAPMRDVATAIGELDDALDGTDRHWLLPALRRRIDNLRDDVDEQRRASADALLAIEHAPRMLGGEGPRTYFIAFTSPAEARATGGFMGSWAEVTADDGRLRLTRYGTPLALNTAATANGARVEGVDADYLDNAGRWIFKDQEQRLVGRGAWSNITTSPHWPTVAAVIAELYPQSGGSPVDGVMMLDVQALARLIGFAGDIALDDGTVVRADTAVEYLLTEQYRTLDQDVRRDVLEEVARTTFGRLIAGRLPSPADLAREMSPMARQGRLAAWSPDPDEQQLFERIHMAAALPRVPTELAEERPVPMVGAAPFSDGIGFTVTNSTGNKIDNWLDVTATYDVDIRNGIVDGTFTIAVVNSAPTTGWGEGIIGNELGLPVGTNRMWLSLYTAFEVVEFRVDGEVRDAWPTRERGWTMSSVGLDLAPGQRATVVVEVRGLQPGDEPYRLLVRMPPLVRPAPLTVTVDGRPLGVPITEPGVVRLVRD